MSVVAGTPQAILESLFGLGRPQFVGPVQDLSFSGELVREH